MERDSKIYIAGHTGMVGSAILRKLRKEGYDNFVLRTSADLDLREMQKVNDFFAKERPDYVFLLAGKVGGINANNTYRAEFLYDNLMIEANVIHASYIHGAKKLLFTGSSCIYPKLAPQPIKEEYMLTGPLEPTNEPYAIAKIAGIKMCDAYRAQYGCNFISCMPTNLYGPNDHYDPQTSHVVPALIRKFYEAKRDQKDFVELWGTGKAKREFLHVDDMAEACCFLMKQYNEPGLINIGYGSDVSIEELAKMIKEISGYKGEIRFDTSKPDGTPRKLIDSEKINKLGWQPKIEMVQGLKSTYEDYSNDPD
ncbi:MAG TPA: GDP-L-fucose synthase [Cytophagaceae bacterium]|nr:GDP-L-fucose synthase [Cytophagaceae bacterium]